MKQRKGQTKKTPEIADVMTPNPNVVHVDHTLAEAAARMRDNDVGLLFVVDGDQLVGALTDRDICCRAVASAIHPADETVMHAMTRHVVFCRADEAVESALRTMEREGVRRLAVLNQLDELVGVVSLSDLALTHSRPVATARVLGRIATPTAAEKRPHRGLPTGGRAIPSPMGEPGNYSARPRLPHSSHVRRSVANGA